MLIHLTNLTSINQFLLPILQPSFTEIPYDRLVVDMEYQVLDAEMKLLFTDIYTYRHTTSKGLFNNKKANSIFLPYIFNLKASGFFLSLKIQNKSAVEKYVSFFDVKVESNNEQFFYFFLALKTFLFAVSIFTFILFLKRYLLQIRQTRETEQRLILTVSVLLIAYNFPFNFYMNYVEPSIALLLISSLVNILFYSYICYIWMVTFEVF